MSEQLSRYSFKHLNDFDLWKEYLNCEAAFNEAQKEVEQRNLINKPVGEWSHFTPQDKNYPKITLENK